MALNPSNNSNLEQLALKVLTRSQWLTVMSVAGVEERWKAVCY